MLPLARRRLRRRHHPRRRAPAARAEPPHGIRGQAERDHAHPGAGSQPRRSLRAARRGPGRSTAVLYRDDRSGSARDQPWSLGSALLAAWRGQPRQAYALLNQVAAEADRQGQGYQLPFAGYARCVLELGRGRYSAACPSYPLDDRNSLRSDTRYPTWPRGRNESSSHGASDRHHPPSSADSAAPAAPTRSCSGFAARVGALAAGGSPFPATTFIAEPSQSTARAPGSTSLARSPACLTAIGSGAPPINTTLASPCSSPIELLNKHRHEQLRRRERVPS